MASGTRYWDKMLPNQPEYSNLYNGNQYSKDLFELIARSSGIGDPRDTLKLEDSKQFTLEEMGSNPVAMQFLTFLIRVAGAKRVLEIGTFVGFASMSFAQALPPDGKVVTIEKFPDFAEVARRNIAKNKLDKKVEVHVGDAFEVIDRLPKTEKFDLIFVDGNKERYKDYVIKTEPLLSQKGIMIVDDCFFHGDAANKVPTDPKGAGSRAFMDYAATADGWHRIAVPISNGIFLMIRKG